MIPFVVSLYGDGLGRIRRGGYIFETWVGDHPPPHVHIIRDGKLIAKVELNDQLTVMKGKIDNKIRRILKKLIRGRFF